MTLNTVGVIGLGLMGRAIADLCLASGRTVVVFDEREAAMESFLKERAAPDLIVRANAIGDLRSASFIFEAIAEDAEAKRRLYAALNTAVPDAILASNSSTYMPSELAVDLDDPSRLLVCHFFNPATLVPLVEIVPGPASGQDIVKTTYDLMRSLGKRPVILKREIPGFIANRLQAAILRECAALIESDAASPETIDDVVKSSLGPRWAACGPLAVADLGGLDIFTALSDRLLPEIARDIQTADVIKNHVANGDLGAKSGQGFYKWSPSEVARAQEQMSVYFERSTVHERERA